MKAHLLLTETSNIDWSILKVIDNSKTIKRVIDWKEKINVLNGVNGTEVHSIDMSKVSVYDNVLILEEKKYAILNMLSK